VSRDAARIILEILIATEPQRPKAQEGAPADRADL
jgi:hypothetical protein